ncbi:VanZ family protein [Lysinibacillus sp. NPDC048646]|uniref:VanZ family protein n=1 Tax=Lysinibacillus sp. NPDC048646 TaxID=3390574 RepID=UPI003CFDCDF3
MDGNILLFMPLGFSIPLRFKVNKFWKVILLGFFISFLVEVIQLFTSIRSFDVDDLILNTLGAIIGFVLYWSSFLWILLLKHPVSHPCSAKSALHHRG